MVFSSAASSFLSSIESRSALNPLRPDGYVSTSLIPLPSDVRNGMVAMGIFGLLSTASTLSLLIFITYRMIFWKRFYDSPIATNQIFILIYNLLLADFQQALSFVISWHWIGENRLVGPSTACFAQGWLIHIGDISSGLFVLSIGVHTFINLVMRRQVPMKLFITGVAGLWTFCLILTAVGPIMRGRDFFVPAGAWCWIDQTYEHDRLYLHYLWIFLAEVGSLVIYISIFFFLRTRLLSSGPHPSNDASASLSSHAAEISKVGPTTTTIITTQGGPNAHDAFANSRKRILRTARYMVVYPFAYVALTLPLAAGRVSAMANKNPPIVFFCVAGTLMASCGVIDVVLYISTRKALVKTSVGLKGSGGSSNPLARFRTADSKRRDVQSGAFRLDDLQGGEEGPAGRRRGMPASKGTIIVSKSVTRSEETKNSFYTDDALGAERAESMKSLVKKEDGSDKSWLA